MAGEMEYREMEGWEDYLACLDIQRETWGPESRDHVPPTLLSVASKVGGVAAGAFHGEEGPMVGFVFGLAGFREGREIHWSHMLAVRPLHRGRGIGRRLKWFQRDRLLEDGISIAFWTYDPLVARNAHLNLNLLGARVEEFVVDMYGSEGDSPLHLGGATDRFVVRWELESPRVERARRGDPEPPPEVPRGAPTVDLRRLDDASQLPRGDAVRLAIHARAEALEDEDPDRARRWRVGLRRALDHYLARGYRITGFTADPGDDRGYYHLQRG